MWRHHGDRNQAEPPVATSYHHQHTQIVLSVKCVTMEEVACHLHKQNSTVCCLRSFWSPLAWCARCSASCRTLHSLHTGRTWCGPAVGTRPLRNPTRSSLILTRSTFSASFTVGGLLGPAKRETHFGSQKTADGSSSGSPRLLSATSQCSSPRKDPHCPARVCLSTCLQTAPLQSVFMTDAWTR